MVSTIHGSPDEHVVWDSDFGVIIGIAAKFSCQILFDVLRCLNRIFTDLIVTTVKQLEYIAEHGSNISAVDFLDYKQERIGSISSAVLEGFHISAHKRTRHIGISYGVLAITVLTGHRLICTNKIGIGVIRMEGHTLIFTAVRK